MKLRRENGTMPADAVCCEIQMVSASDLEGGTVVRKQPVWKYTHGGREYVTADNCYLSKKRSLSEGDTAEILIDPDKPERILTEYCPIRPGIRVIVGVLFIVWAVYKLIGS